MYLQSLELFGFKSFAPRTVLQFHRGVTCVVGPNGCGKSNVLDAIRWVLGEQSAKALRGGEMADVIFSGTDSRSALGMAEVSMNFAECEKELGVDWSEVTITRRVFRDGGSEYLLNKTPCRLKDIHQLFMDTGIGRSAYSIMEQGKIDQILSSRPEDRRAIFEEAAGITKFKSQRKEALRKLEATEANLVRIDDIIKEVRRQIGTLQRQAGKARRYQALLSELKTLETHSARRQWEVLDEQLQAGRGELEGLRGRQAELEEEIESGESDLSVRRSVLSEMEQKLEGARRVVNDLRTRISNHENRIVFNREKGEEFAGLVARYRGDVAGAEEKLRMAEGAIRQADAELAQIAEMLSGEQERMAQKQEQAALLGARRTETERALQTLSQDLQRLENRVSSLRGQMASVTQAREGAEARLSILAAETEQLRAAEGRLEEQLGGGREELARTQRGLEERNVELADLEGQLGLGQMGIATVEGELRGMQKTVLEKESRLEVLESLVRSGEGFSAGTQAVLKGLDNPDFFKGSISGALGQYIEVEAPYVAAVEAVLGANLQAIVMKDITIAEHIVKTLSGQKLGRAVLALRELDSAFEHVENESLELPPGALGWLIHKIKAQPEVGRLIERLVNFAVLVPDVETALKLFPRKGWTIVTLGGEVLTGDGMLHGGRDASGASASVLERKNEIAGLSRELSGLREQVSQKQALREQLSAELQALQSRLREVREEKQNATVAVSTLKGQLTLLEREANETRRKLQGMEGEQGAAQARFYEAEQKAEALESEVHAVLAQIEEQQACRQQLGTELEVARAQEAEVLAEWNELKVRVATEKQRHASLTTQRQPMEARLAELNELIVQRERDIEAYEGRAASTLAENAELEASLEALRGRVGESEQAVGELLSERSAIAAEVEEEANALRARRSQLSGIHEQRSRLEVRIHQIETRTTTILEHIRKRYDVDLAQFQRDTYVLKVAFRDALKRQRSGGGEGDAEAAPAPVDGDRGESESLGAEAYELDWGKIESLVRELDQRIHAMGPVNLDAIVEFEELEQRYAFLEKQQLDLLHSKDELLGVIARINTTTRQLFSETFEKIRTNFQEMFTELFGGGRANLVLTDESDPLESGIEIIAKPPGKQLQSISLLSGGEKTMTAVSLLFSIYMVKPSPFCVLDEMDAPLDESNINRFIKILDRFVGQSQFVVISHNKKTIARADALYGVTMEEHGVSRLVGVKFTKREESRSGADITGTNNPDVVPSVAETFGKSPNLHSENKATETA
ncbi:MAG: chromosome segregation protein [Verrucomicrobiota bacterium]|jgi:chromosome segregation protein